MQFNINGKGEAAIKLTKTERSFLSRSQSLLANIAKIGDEELSANASAGCNRIGAVLGALPDGGKEGAEKSNGDAQSQTTEKPDEKADTAPKSTSGGRGK